MPAERTLRNKGRSSSLPPVPRAALPNPAVMRLRDDEQAPQDDYVTHPEPVDTAGDASLSNTAWDFGIDPAHAGPPHIGFAAPGL
ncbi:hypothetical protein HDU96_005561, partial [Phlyctochytrium bullatum]